MSDLGAWATEEYRVPDTGTDRGRDPDAPEDDR